MTGYTKWIKTNVPTYESSYGKCHEVCMAMNKKFPELKLIRGWYTDLGLPPNKEQRQHWWLKTDDGEIIDPTSKQFYIPDIQENYEEFIVGKHKIPTGKCMNCGELCYDGKINSCSAKCSKALHEYYNCKGKIK